MCCLDLSGANNTDSYWTCQSIIGYVFLHTPPIGGQLGIVVVRRQHLRINDLKVIEVDLVVANLVCCARQMVLKQ